MTASIASNPALATLALTASQAPPSGAPGALPPQTGAPAAAGVAGTPRAAAASAFPALLLGLRTATPTSPAAPATTAAALLPADGLAPEGPTPTATGLSSPGQVPAMVLPTDTPGGKPAGEALPETGTDLPAADVTALLASLAAPAPAAGFTPPAPALTGAAPRADSEGAASPTAANNSPSQRGLPAQSVPVANPTLVQVQTQAQAQTQAGTNPDDAATAALWMQSADVDAPDSEIGATDSLLADSMGGSAQQRGMDLALPAEFRARLEAMLNAAIRPAITADPALTAPGSIGTVTTLAPNFAPDSSAAAEIFDAMPVLEPLTNRNAWTQGLGDRLMMMAEKGLQSATIKLHPEHLGPMEIRIQVDDDGSAQVLFSAHHAQTREALETAMPRLRDLFADQGLNLMQANVDSGRSAFAQRGFAAELDSWSRWAGDEPDAAVPENASAWRLSRGSERRVDVLV